MKDLTILDNLILGRVEPYIYAFTTNTVPNYLKVGDTYRPVSVRLNEWQRHYPELEKQFENTAKVADDIFFRDYSVHQFLESDLQKERLKPGNLERGINFSNEFFKDTEPNEVTDAIADIASDYATKGNKYQFYNAFTSFPCVERYNSTGYWEPRPNQQATIDAFKRAVGNGRTTLLMYAVMRFGKSFTSMCCAAEMGAHLVVVVSAKADVKEEWRKTVESAENFRNDYEFLSSVDLGRNHNIVSDTFAKPDGRKNVVLFLTLQDLQGDVIKDKHQQIFGREVDLLIIDETHFGARAEKYGQVLKNVQFKGEKAHKKDNDDYVEITDAEEKIKTFPTKVKLHLSGTPYRILMGGEFQKEDIIAFYQFSDIVSEQEAWDNKNLLKDKNDDGTSLNEWDNPYYGFPQMVRFAFNPNVSSRKKLDELRKNGITFAFSELFRPKSIKKAADSSHMVFKYENEILELLEVIDGSKDDENLLGFLDYDKIKTGMMCRHMVCVLPYCAACDSLETLIKTKSARFRNLCQYEIINISGVEKPNTYKTPKAIKDAIKKFEAEGKKTITLTVNRMLTGSTVEEWDTMLYFKDTASPQEYDQAIFRLQNQYIKTFKDEYGDNIKYNMKPQTLLVDFDPNRMFQMQEQKAQIYNVNVDDAGNSKLSERLSEELRISPIIIMNKNKIEQINSTDILKAVSEYSRNRGVAEETNDIPVDLSLMDISDIWDVIKLENELGSKSGFEIKASEGEGNDSEVPETDVDTETNIKKPDTTKSGNKTDDEKTNRDPAKQFRMYYARILYFAFLTKDIVFSLDSIIDCIAKEDNARIFKNLGLRKGVLEALKNNMDKFMLRPLDYSIHRLNQLSHDDSVPALERAIIANQKFGKLGESQVVTPAKVCDDMIALLPDEFLRECVETRISLLDIASKEGEFSIALCKRYESLGFDREAIKDIIYSIPTSSLTYEFTRKIYEVLGLSITNIAAKYNSYDLLNITVGDSHELDLTKIRGLLRQRKPFNEITTEDEEDFGGEKEMIKFGAVVGNPPYQLDGASGGTSDASIYQDFAIISEALNPEFISLVIQSRWFTAGRENLLGKFRSQMLNNRSLKNIVYYSDSRDVFPDVSIKGGICYYLIDHSYNGDCSFTLMESSQSETSTLKLNEFDILIRYPKIAEIVQKVNAYYKDEQFVVVESIISNDTPFGIPTNPKESKKNPYNVFDTPTPDHNTTLYYIDKSVRKCGYVNRNDIKKNAQQIDCFKTLIPTGYGAGEGFPHQILGAPELALNNSVCSQSYLYVPFETRLEAEAFTKYLKSKFFRILVLAYKITQSAPNKVFRFVPIQDFKENSDIDWKKSVKEIDMQLYAKYCLTQDEINYIESKIKPME